MSLVRERRHKQALRLSLPSPVLAADLRHNWSPLPSPSSSISSSTSASTLSSDSPGIDHLFDDLEKLEVLGHGNGGTVYKVQHRRSSSVYALKVLRFDEDAIAIREQAAREAEILKRVDSQFIVKCHGIFKRVDSQFIVKCHGIFDNRFEETGCAGRDLCFVMEYMEAGSLHDVLCSHRRLPERVISDIARRVLEGLHYLHGMQIVHRDIKPSNLLINSKGEIKIADFGVSRLGKLEAGNNSYMGTSAYMSPERFDSERWNGDYSDGFAGDVWSLGLVVLECHMGHFPLISPGQKPDWATLMCAICFGGKMEMPETASPELRSFVWRCLEKDWRKRGTVTELLSHPFVTNLCNLGSSSREELVGYASEG